MRDYYNVKINLPGGIASPGVLKEILSVARKADVYNVRFGARQQLLMTVHYEQMKFLERDLKTIGVAHNINPEKHPNIISSYCGEDVFRTGQWL
ncbi:MAG TPA: rubredoxin, partial [Dyadobacter sp.]|nr:rubredoxin [Dyadobacter sp.]